MIYLGKKGVLLFCLGLFICSACEKEQAKEAPLSKLWYEQPAKAWEDALPLGNGRLGIMLFGDPIKERIQLNDDSLWPHDLDWDEPAGTKEDLDKIRSLLFEQKHTEADALFVKQFSRKQVVRSHQTLGDLFIDFDHKEITDYRRELDISEAIAKVSYRSDGYLVEQKAFVSHPHKVIVVELSSEAPEGINATIRLSRPMDDGFPTVEVKSTSDQHLVMQGQVTQRTAKFDSKPAPILEGVQFETRLKIVQEGGNLSSGPDFLELKKVKQATFYLVSNSSFYFDDYQLQNQKDLAAIEQSDLSAIQAAHLEDYQHYYQRVGFNLNGSDLDTLPTDERLTRIKLDSLDLDLEALLFQYGRYLLISSSRPGTNPANLQGLWNPHITAPWNADYHLNINLQMNYWLANQTNLEELNEPLFDYIDKLIENGKVTAEKNFGCRGSFIPHATDLWAPTWLRAPTAYWGCSVGAGGWLMQHYWQHFTYTADTTFLRERAFPAMESVAQFYSDWLIEDPRDGSLISAPSTSPENRFLDAQENPVATCLGSAMDQQVIGEVFDNYLNAARLLGNNAPLREKIQAQKAQLRPGFVLDDDGRILEWDRAYKELEPGHRHMSHLYGFHPGVSVSKDQHPDVFAAVRKTLDHRLDNGGAGTGWSRAWLINCWARLLEGDLAHEHIQLLLQKSMYSNLFDAHPPFQIDGNFGYTAGVAEMLLQSHEPGIMRVLPALPSAWKDGRVSGLKARGGLSVDMSWKANQLEKLEISSHLDQQFELLYQDKKIPVKLKAGIPFHYQGD